MWEKLLFVGKQHSPIFTTERVGNVELKRVAPRVQHTWLTDCLLRKVGCRAQVRDSQGRAPCPPNPPPPKNTLLPDQKI